jgi:hypothetical protein
MSSTGSVLSQALERINELSEEIKELEEKSKALRKQRDHFEELAINEMSDSRLDGVKAAGRSWRVESEHSFHIPSDRKSEVVNAARRLGRDDIVTVATTSLKAFLRELAREAGKSGDMPWADDTEFAGIVSEYIRPKLRSVSA